MEPIVYITIPYSVLKAGTALTEVQGMGVNVLLDSVGFELPVLVQLFPRAAGCIFSLSGSLLDQASTEVVQNKVYTLFTVTGSFQGNFNNIPVFYTNAPEHPGAIKKLEEYFDRQGEHEVYFVGADPTLNGVSGTILFCDLAHLASLNEAQLETYNKAKVDQVVLSLGTLPDAEEIKAGFDRVIRENRFASLLLEMVSLRRKLNQSARQAALWESRATLYLSFINLSKAIGEKDYRDIKQWYHKEYEVLPLWFKRVGHLVKVLTGKRTLKSLFDNSNQ